MARQAVNMIRLSMRHRNMHHGGSPVVSRLSPGAFVRQSNRMLVALAQQADDDAPSLQMPS